ncbi:hypothetical protein AAFN46_20125 [Pseudomonas sp. CAU 1711]|uniref:hypothetical protein n=1 Tax=Pseudomonas sp. CAU 1711 TaxID=3140356 RepID=UPI0032607F47
MSKKIQSAVSSIEIAKNWEAKNQPAWVVRCLSSALMNYLSVAVCEVGQKEEACAWLRQNEVDKLLAKYSNSVRLVVSDVERGKLPASALGGAYSHLVFAHLSWLLNAPETGRFFASVGSLAEIVKISTPFWADYAKCFQALVSGKKLAVTLGELKGQEKYWASYVALMSAAMSGDGLQRAIQVVDNSFAERNSDSSIADDSYEIEGSGQCPARWDFRKESLLVAMRLMS